MNGFHVYMSQYSLLSLHEFCDARGSRPIKTAYIFLSVLQMEAVCPSSSVGSPVSDCDYPVNLQCKTGLINHLCDVRKMAEFDLHARNIEFDTQNEE